MKTKDKKKTKDSVMSQKEYIKSCMCPFCKSKDIAGDVIEVGEVGAYQRISCNSCSAIWSDNYKLAGYTVIKEPVKDNKIVGTDNAKDQGYVDCPFCRNKNIVGIKEATIESPAIMQYSICTDCSMTFAAIIGYVKNFK